MDNDLKIKRKKILEAACVPDFSRKFNPYDYMEEIDLSELALRITEEKKKEEEQRTRAREFLLIKDEWSEQEVIDLFTHGEISLMPLICASINAGKLKFLRKHGDLYGEPEIYYFEPLAITKWIISKKIPLPNDVLAWFNEQTKQTEERKEEQTKSVVGERLQERLNKIRNFMSLLTEAAKTKGIEFDPMQLQLTKVQLLSELKSRYKNFNIKIDAFELVWTEATKAGICASSTANTKKGKTFLNSIFG